MLMELLYTEMAITKYLPSRSLEMSQVITCHACSCRRVNKAKYYRSTQSRTSLFKLGRQMEITKLYVKRKNRNLEIFRQRQARNLFNSNNMQNIHRMANKFKNENFQWPPPRLLLNTWLHTTLAIYNLINGVLDRFDLSITVW